MSTPQRQDLIIFNDQTVIPSELVSNGKHHMFLVTSTIATQPLWLINALIETKVLGAPFSLNRSATERTALAHLESSLTIASFIHERDFYRNALQKLKIDANSYELLDMLINFVLKNNDKPRNKILDGLVELFPTDIKSTIVLEQPELLLSLLDGLTSDDLNNKLILPLMKKCGLLIVSSNIDAFQNNENDPLENTRDANECSRFLTSLIYKSIVILNLRSLETGRAKDVTGSLVISRGGQYSNNLSVHVIENEYLYLTEKETTKLFYR